MIWAYELLGVATDADATTIKRAYARLLHTTRPDEDAAAFQRLNVAYQAALAQANRRQAMSAAAPVTVAQPIPESFPASAHPPGSEVNAAAPPTPPEVAKPETSASGSPLPSLEVLRPATPPPAPPVNAMELALRVIHEAGNAKEPSVLSHWLEHRPELWSFRIKQVTGQLMLQRLVQDPQPMPTGNLDVLLRFFDLDHVLSGVNPMVLEQLRHRLTVQWEMRHDHASLARRVGVFTNGQPQTWRLRNCLDLLKQPRRWRSVIAVTLTRGQAIQLARIVQTLCSGHIKQLPAEINREHAQFWLRASGPSGSSLEQMTTGAIRALVFALVCVTTIAILIVTLTLDGNSSPEEWRESSLILVTAFGGILLAWIGLQGASWLDRWQSRPETTPSPKPWLRRLFIPLVGSAGFGLGCLGAPPWVAWGLELGTLFLAIRRHDRRAPAREKKPAIRYNPVIIICGGPILAAITAAAVNALLGSINLPLLAVAFAATLIVWGLDMWRHGMHWRQKKVI